MTDQPMDPDVLDAFRKTFADGWQISGNHPRGIVTGLLSAHDHWHRLAIRHEELRRQTEAVCERRTAEREDARHGMMIARAERDAAQLKISELEDTLAATLESWKAYAAAAPAPLVEFEPNESRCQAPQCLKFRARNDGAVWSSCARCGGTGLDPGYIPPPAPGECVECRASPGHWHHPDCSMSEGEPVPAESLSIKLPPQGES